MSLITHAATDATRHARFPGDEPVSASGLRDLARVRPPRAAVVLTGPELRTRETASKIFPDATPHPGLGDISYGEWVGRVLTDLGDVDVASWLTDTAFVPPGGESVDSLFERVSEWLGGVGAGESAGRVVAVTHPAVVRAVVVLALGAPRQSFWRIDVPALTSTSLNGRGGRWTLKTVSEKLR